MLQLIFFLLKLLSLLTDEGVEQFLMRTTQELWILKQFSISRNPIQNSICNIKN